MATKKKATKKTTKKVTKKVTKKTAKKAPVKSVTQPEKVCKVPPAASPAPAPALAPAPAPAEAVPLTVAPYVHMGQRHAGFLKDHPGANVYDRILANLTRKGGEELLASLSAPAFVNVPQGVGWTAADLAAHGFEVAINGEGGQLFGVKV